VTAVKASAFRDGATWRPILESALKQYEGDETMSAAIKSALLRFPVFAPETN